jgi:hypothetical protein
VIRRLFACLARDLRVQYRARYPFAALLGFAVWSAAIRFTPEASAYVLAPAFLFLNAYLLSFSLALRQAMTERNEGSLAALDLTPVRPQEFLAARAAGIALLVLAQTGLLAWAGGKPAASYASLFLGTGLAGVQLSLAAFLVMAAAANGGLMAMRFGATLLLLGPPLLPFLGFVPGPWLHAHPLQGPLVLLQGTYFPLPMRAAGIAVASGAAWCAVLLAACRWGLNRLRRADA